MTTEQLLRSNSNLNTDNIRQLTDMVEDLQRTKQEIDNLENKVTRLKAYKKKLEEETIPDSMLEMGMDSVKLTNGLSVEVSPFYYARLPPVTDNRPKSVKDRETAMQWLRDNGHGGIISESIVVIPSIDNAQLIIDILKEIHAAYEEKSGVQWKRLESWFKEVVSDGQDVPFEMFSGFVGRRAKVK